MNKLNSEFPQTWVDRWGAWKLHSLKRCNIWGYFGSREVTLTSAKCTNLLAADHWWGSKKELFLSQPALIICHHCHLQQCSPVFITNPDLTAKYSDS